MGIFKAIGRYFFIVYNLCVSCVHQYENKNTMTSYLLLNVIEKSVPVKLEPSDLGGFGRVPRETPASYAPHWSGSLHFLFFLLIFGLLITLLLSESILYLPRREYILSVFTRGSRSMFIM